MTSWVNTLLALSLIGCALPEDYGTYDTGFIKGMNIFFMPPRNAFIAQDYIESLDKLGSLGVNTLYLVPYYFSTDESSGKIYPTSATIPDSQLIQAISLSRERGFAVVLKPHLDLVNGVPRYKISPADYPLWLAGYKAFILHYLEISKAMGLTDFVIGTELDIAVEHKEFQQFCDSLQGSTSIKLTYAASFEHFISTNIWDHVDRIGINAYFNLDNNRPPSISTLHETWNYWLNLVSAFSESKGMPVVFTEVAYFSRSTAAVNPGVWSGNSAPDPAVQRDCYHALLSQAWEFDRIKGIVWWQWELGGIGSMDNNDATPRGKPAEDVIRRYWSK
jgi:hypothetical protein